MVIQDKAIGVLTVGNHRKRSAFDENLAAMLEILAGYAAIAIANARLFTMLERRAKNMEHAYEELKARNAQHERVIIGMGHLRQNLVDLQSDIKRASASGLPAKLVEHFGGLDQKITGLLASVGELSR